MLNALTKALFPERPGGRGGQPEHRLQAGPPGRVLRRVPPQLHPLPEDLRTTWGGQRVALPLPRLQGGLQGHHALQLVGSSHSGPGLALLHPHLHPRDASLVLFSGTASDTVHTLQMHETESRAHELLSDKQTVTALRAACLIKNTYLTWM